MALSAAGNLCRGLVKCSYPRLMLKVSKVPGSQIKSLPLQMNFFTSFKINAFRSYSKKNSEWVTITFEKHDGTRFERKGKVGSTVQELIGSENPDFPGYGACDGTVSCSTCHVILKKEDFEKLGKPSDEEDDTLDLSPCLTDTSRLSCCITLTADLDGMLLKLPAKVKDLRES